MHFEISEYNEGERKVDRCEIYSTITMAYMVIWLANSSFQTARNAMTPTLSIFTTIIMFVVYSRYATPQFRMFIATQLSSCFQTSCSSINYLMLTN